MAKNRVLFHKGSGDVVGVLQKFEEDLFDAQRGLENYHVVKMSEDQLLEAFEYKDLGAYTPIYYDDLIVFPHEECSVVDMADSRIQIYVQSGMPRAIPRMVDSIRYTNEEEALVKMALGTTLNVMGQIVDMELNAEDSLHYRDYLIHIMKEFDVKEGYK